MCTKKAVELLLKRNPAAFADVGDKTRSFPTLPHGRCGFILLILDNNRSNSNVNTAYSEKNIGINALKAEKNWAKEELSSFNNLPEVGAILYFVIRLKIVKMASKSTQ